MHQIKYWMAAVSIGSVLTQMINAKLCTVSMSATTGYRERQGNEVYRELQMAAEYQPDSQDAENIEKLLGAHLVITALTPKHNPPRPYNVEFTPAYSHYISLTDEEVETGVKKIVTFGPKQHLHFSYIQPYYDFVAKVLDRNGNVACQQEQKFLPLDIREMRPRSGTEESASPTDFFIGKREQPYTRDEIRRMSEAMTAIESMEFKKTGYQPAEPALNLESTDPVDMMENLMKRANGVYESMTQKSLQCAYAPAIMANLQKMYEPLSKWGIPYARYTSQSAMQLALCWILPTPMVLFAPLLDTFFDWYYGPVGGRPDWKRLFSPKHAIQSYSSTLKWYGENVRERWVNVVSPERALRDVLIEEVEDDGSEVGFIEKFKN